MKREMPFSGAAPKIADEWTDMILKWGFNYNIEFRIP